jgi:hypothetical protein
MKVCITCLIEKDIEEFPFKNKKINKRINRCRICENARKREYKKELYTKNPEKRTTDNLANKKSKDKNKEYYKEYRKEYRKKNKEHFDNYNKEWREKNKEYYDDYHKNYRDNNRDVVNERVREWRKNNPEKTKQISLNKKENPLHNIRRDARYSVKIYLFQKSTHRDNTLGSYIGLTPKQLREHFETLFKEGMTWDNHGSNGWHIDHIIPLNTAKNKEEVLNLCHYTNLQPLWAKENFIKGHKVL